MLNKELIQAINNRNDKEIDSYARHKQTNKKFLIGDDKGNGYPLFCIGDDTGESDFYIEYEDLFLNYEIIFDFNLL